MSFDCQSCELLMERVKEKMVHIEQMRGEILRNEEDRNQLQIKSENLNQKNVWLEKEKEVLKRQLKYLKEENHKLAEKLKVKHVECIENYRLLDVIYKDRDECIEEKMKVSRFYRSELKKLSEENDALRKENDILKKKYEDDSLERLVQAIFGNPDSDAEKLKKVEEENNILRKQLELEGNEKIEKMNEIVESEEKNPTVVDKMMELKTELKNGEKAQKKMADMESENTYSLAEELEKLEKLEVSKVNNQWKEQNKLVDQKTDKETECIENVVKIPVEIGKCEIEQMEEAIFNRSEENELEEEHHEENYEGESDTSFEFIENDEN